VTGTIAGPPDPAPLAERLELVADRLTFPTSLAFDNAGGIFVAEAGLPFGGAPPGGRIWRLRPGGARDLVADQLQPPVNGLAWHERGLYVSGGSSGYIRRIEPDGSQATILDHLPGPGNYHTNMTVFGPDGKLYFSQGALTNAGVVGLDAYELGWLRQLPHAYDLPGYDIVLTGENIRTPNPLSSGENTQAVTGAFAPFGTPTQAGQRIGSHVPCTAGIMRCEPDGEALEVVAWGLRNAFGLGFLPDGRLLAVDQGPDDRGSRPIGQAPDLLFEVRRGAWYGWPDFIDGDPVDDPRYQPERGPAPRFLLANHRELPRPERALLRFPPHTAAVKFAVAPPAWGTYAGHLFVALFGDEQPMTAPAGPRTGRGVARIDPAHWSLHPAITGLMARPIDVSFHPIDAAMHILDFGRFEMTEGGRLSAEPESGKLWRLPK
jgi:glucose/arabinose dehydrogenase